MAYINYSHYICHAEIQLNDVIKVSDGIRPLVALSIQTDTTKNGTNTGVGIGASLLIIMMNVKH